MIIPSQWIALFSEFFCIVHRIIAILLCEPLPILYMPVLMETQFNQAKTL